MPVATNSSRGPYPRIDYDTLYSEIEHPMTQAVDIARRLGATPYIVFADLDGLTGLNKRFGCDVCDTVVFKVEQLVKDAARSNFATRFGGDQFVIVAYGSGEGAPNETAERVVELVAGYQWGSVVSNLYVHVSAGFASVRTDEPVRKCLFRAVEGARAAKRAGGNCAKEAPQFLHPGTTRSFNDVCS